MHILAANYSSPVFWAVMVGWIISVTLHELAHGIVGYLGGDYTVRERGGLSLNPLQYAHPVMTFALPLLAMLMGGVPLMGGATYIRRDLLRNRFWQSAVSLAGPAMNILLCVICMIPLYPRFGWVDPDSSPDVWTTGQIFCGALAVLQMWSVLLNLLPVPGLDGFGAIAPWLPEHIQAMFSDPRIRTGAMILFFTLMCNQAVAQHFFDVIDHIMGFMGFDDSLIEFTGRAYNMALFGSTGF
jgi:Zn-dependent protease